MLWEVPYRWSGNLILDRATGFPIRVRLAKPIWDFACLDCRMQQREETIVIRPRATWLDQLIRLTD